MRFIATFVASTFLALGCHAQPVRAPAAAAHERAPAPKSGHVPAASPPAMVAEQAAHKTPDPDAHAIAELESALSLHQQFLERAGGDERYADAAQRSRERIADIRETLSFLRQGQAERGE